MRFLVQSLLMSKVNYVKNEKSELMWKMSKVNLCEREM